MKYDISALITEKVAATILGLSVSRLQKWRDRRQRETKGPPYKKFGRAVRYSIPELEAYILANTIGALTEEPDRHIDTEPRSRRQ